MNTRKELCQQNLLAVEEDPGLLQRVITGDESWIYGYDIETKAQSSQWCFKGERRPKKIRQSRSNVKGIVHHEFLPYGSTVTKEYYQEVLRRLRENVRRKRPELWKNNSWVLHHDNAPAHTSLLIANFLQKYSITVLPQAPYSPDLAPCDFFLFPKIKTHLKGQRFDTPEEIKQNSQTQLRAIPESAFQNYFEEWKKRWNKCIAAEGAYFEGDKTNLDD
ncbi:uncharacterized protein LOC105286551 [Ooceraea biroi]|uniref:uncharacterized protein LOC105286551 n=1 Tax=Ooceraea biroi TaxID=2015173 RepID=UPI000F087670|nr:uncharacterized protein LOC105286551 [Ooceraea biroi]